MSNQSIYVHPNQPSDLESTFRMPGTTRMWHSSDFRFAADPSRPIPTSTEPSSLGLPLFRNDGTTVLYEAEARWLADAFELLFPPDIDMVWVEANQNYMFKPEIRIGRVALTMWNILHYPNVDSENPPIGPDIIGSVMSRFHVSKNVWDGSWGVSFSLANYSHRLQDSINFDWQRMTAETHVIWTGDKLIRTAYAPVVSTADNPSTLYRFWTQAKNLSSVPAARRTLLSESI